MMYLTPLRYGGTVAVNPASPYALALLHFDGSNGSTTYTDEYSNTWVSTGSYAPQTLSTTQAEFGVSSLRSIYSVDSGKLAASIAGVDASSDLSVDFWYYYAYTEGTLDKFYGQEIVQFYLNNRDYKLQTTSYGGAYQLIEFGESIQDNSSFACLQDSWNHFRIVRVGGTVTLSINGAVAITLTGTAGGSGTATLGIEIGNTGVNQLEGYIDEFYVTAEALPTTFTPPTEPWPNQ